MARFWIAATGRSGTRWLARTLNNSPTHTVRHEEADAHHPLSLEQWSPFPVERWEGGRYGECHGILRRYLSAEYAGPERLIPGRYVLLRQKRAVVASWLRITPPAARQVSWVTYAVCLSERRLLAYKRSDPGCRRLELEQLTASTANLQLLVDELGLGFEATPAMLEPVGAGEGGAFEWTPAAEATFRRLVKRFGDSEGI